MSNIKILIVTPGFPSQAVNNISAVFVLTEAKSYAINGADVTVVTPHYYPAPINEVFDKNIKVKRFRYFWPVKYECLVDPMQPIYRKKRVLAYIQIPFFIVSFIINVLKHSKKADIIHCQWTTSVLFALPAKWIFKKKIVVTARGSDIRLMPKWLNRLIHKHVNAAIDCYGPQQWNEKYKENFPSNFIKLPLITIKKDIDIMPKDMAILVKREIKPYIIIYLGRFNKTKLEIHGLPIFTLIESAAKLKKEGRNVQIFYIGSGDEEIICKMKELIEEYSVSDIVHLLGSKNNVMDYIPFCDLGIGGTAFDAVSQEFSFNKKIQILVFGRYNEYTPWKDRKNAIFFHDNSVESLTESILFAMRKDDEIEHIRNDAYKLINKFVVGPEEGGRLYLKAFSELLKENIKL